MHEVVITVGRRFRGPGGFGHGGYFAGLIARAAPGISSMRFLSPIPLGRPLSVLISPADEVKVLDGSTEIARGLSEELQPQHPDPVTFDVAERASRHFEGFEQDGARHPFPECFGCGHERSEGDGLRVFAGPVEGRLVNGRPVLAARWIPHPAFVDDQGLVRPEFVWALLDCPGGWAIPDQGISTGTLSARLEHPVRQGERCIVMAWQVIDPTASPQSRRRYGSCALFSEIGELRAFSQATWILDRGR